MPAETIRLTSHETTIPADYSRGNQVTLHHGHCADLLAQLPSGEAALVVTSPPYNIGKEYERKRSVSAYVAMQAEVIAEATRVCADNGSVCWQVGNYVENGEIVPLDVLLYPVFADLGLHLRNRVVWHFEHGLHCSKRFSGRYEVILWFTKTDNYCFDLDAVRAVHSRATTQDQSGHDLRGT